MLLSLLYIDSVHLILKLEYYFMMLFLLILFLVWVKRKYPTANLFFLIILFIYRIPFLFVYFKFIPGDWIAYIEWAKERDLNKLPEEIGTQIIPYFLKYYVAFEMGPIDMFFGFSFLAYIAVVLVYLTIHKLTDLTDKVNFFGVNIFPWILLYPSLHMYTQMVGKDPIIFLGTALVLYSTVGRKLNYLLLFLGLFLAIIVRPHIGVILLVSFGIALLFSDKIRLGAKLLLLFISAAVGVRMIPLVIQFFLLDSFSLESIQSRINITSQHADFASTYVDTSSYPIPLKMFTYLFRPFPHEFGTPLLLEYSLENVFFFLLFLSVFRWNFFGWLKRQPMAIKFSFMHWFLGTLVLCNGLGVYGLFIRQKTMVFPLMLTFVFAFIYYNKKIKQKSE